MTACSTPDSCQPQACELCLQEKVYANAEVQAKAFLEYVQSSQDFDFDGDREYDGGSFDQEFSGSARSSSS